MDALDQEIAAKTARRDKLRQQADQLDIELNVLRRAAALRPVTPGLQPVSAAATVAPLVPSVTLQPVVATAAVADFVKRATADPTPNEGSEPRRGGRKPGAISADWRNVLAILYLAGGAHSYVKVHEIAAQNGINIDISSTRERVRTFVERGLMKGSPNDGFEVTWDAMRRFGFRREPAPDGESVSEPEYQEQ